MIGYNEKYQAIKAGQIYGIYSVCATHENPLEPQGFEGFFLCFFSIWTSRNLGRFGAIFGLVVAKVLQIFKIYLSLAAQWFRRLRLFFCRHE